MQNKSRAFVSRQRLSRPFRINTTCIILRCYINTDWLWPWHTPSGPLAKGSSLKVRSWRASAIGCRPYTTSIPVTTPRATICIYPVPRLRLVIERSSHQRVIVVRRVFTEFYVLAFLVTECIPIFFGGRRRSEFHCMRCFCRLKD